MSLESMSWITYANRQKHRDEVEFWLAIEAGEHISPPRPCQECGQMWEHHPRCVANAPQPSGQEYTPPQEDGAPASR
jgi:hypothetical protein